MRACELSFSAIRAVAIPGLLTLFMLGTGVGSGQSGPQKTKKQKKTKKHICISFDQLPSAQAFSPVNRILINEKTLQALKKHKVKAAGFVVGGQIGESYDILGNWLNDGHLLGNLTYSNQDLHSIGIENFIKEVRNGGKALETMLSGFGQKKRYFRYPYLHYGDQIETKRQVSLYLEDKNFIVAHASVIVEDYLYNLSLEKMGSKPDSVALENLLAEYLQHVKEELARAEMLSTELLKRRCRHILLLRANMLNALALDDLLSALESMGYQFISLDYALKDKVYSAPDAYFGARGVGYLDMIRQADTDMLPAE